MYRRLTFNILFIALGACGRSPDFRSELTDQALESRNVIILAAGGYNSCSDATASLDFAPKIQELSETLAPKYNSVTVVKSCFPKFGSNIFWVGADGKKSPKTESEFVNEVTMTSRANDNASLILIGHSYGGWLVEKIAAKILEEQTQPLKLLVTIDSISKNKCTPLQLATTLVSTDPNRKPHAGCAQFPKDLTQETTLLREHFSNWLNFYQDAGRFLHSGQSQAQDFHIDFENVDTSSVLPHISIDTSTEVWSTIFDLDMVKS